MLADVASMNASDYLNKVVPLINPMIQVENLSSKINQLEKEMQSRISKAKAKPYWVSFLYGLLCSFVFSILGLIQMIKTMRFSPYAWNFSSIVVFFSSSLIMFFYLLWASKRKITKIKYEYSQQESTMIIHRNNTTHSIYSILQEYVPQEYWYSSAMNRICGYLSNGRAMNPMQAFNLYEEEMHRMRMEQMQSNILAANQRQAFFSAITAVASISTAVSASSINSKLE